jgi:ABC-type multidrug transport system fused ATPase/permease subunit
MGNVEAVNNLGAIKDAAVHGGAMEFIEAHSKKFDAEFEWTGIGVSIGDIPKGSKLEKVVNSIKPEKLELSGGQFQRLAL